MPTDSTYHRAVAGHRCRIPYSSSSLPEPGSLTELRRRRPFQPPFCTNPVCAFRRARSARAYRQAHRQAWYILWGHHHNRSFGAVKRFRCRSCGKTCSEASFSLDYAVKRPVDYRMLAELMSASCGTRALSRTFRVSTSTVANRISRLARSALLSETRMRRYLTHREPLAFDGFRSFSRSQYFPCDITLLVGAHSEYLYTADYALLRRGGAMTCKQKLRRAQIESNFRADPQATAQSVDRIYDYICATTAYTSSPRTVRSDDHQSYRQRWFQHPAIVQLQRLRFLSRSTVSSRKARTAVNPLRSVNYFDREIRKDLAEHHRETLNTARTTVGMMERLSVYRYQHNYHKKKRITGSRAPDAREVIGQSHAAAAGIPAEVITREHVRMLTERPFQTHSLVMQFDELLWNRDLPNPPDGYRMKLPRFLTA